MGSYFAAFGDWGWAWWITGIIGGLLIGTWKQ